MSYFLALQYISVSTAAAAAAATDSVVHLVLGRCHGLCINLWPGVVQQIRAGFITVYHKDESFGRA